MVYNVKEVLVAMATNYKIAILTHNGLRMSAVDMVHEGLDVSRGVVHVGDGRIRIQATRVHLVAILEIGENMHC